MRSLTLILSLLFLPLVLAATHNRAGEIIVRAAGDCADINSQLSACATIITYTETVQTEVDRDSLFITWGDGTGEWVQRTARFPIGNGIQRNEYTQCHRYSGFGTYYISFEDMNRVANVLNIDGGNSVGIPFSVSTAYTLSNPLLNGCNSSPEMTQVPIENACTGQIWTHNPGAFDVDGDSLAFEFTDPQRGARNPIANYVRPHLAFGATGTLEIDERTGQITWDTPQRVGEYNLAFMVKSFRNGIPLDTVVRDMQIFVTECANIPPTLDIPMEEICVVAGELIEFDVIAGAPVTEEEQLVRLEASGRPFGIANAATFLPNDSTYRADPLTRTFRWQPGCAEVSNQPYIVVFRAEDNFFDLRNLGLSRGGLATVRSVSIRVVAPPPEDLRTTVEEESITLTWEKPYFCEESEDPRFLGFTVWRREGSNNFAADTCETGLAGRGYTLVTPTETTEMLDGRYVYVDEDIEGGRTYCYRVVALLGRPIANLGLIFEEIESIPSEEICVQLAREIPLLTNVDITATDGANGEIDVCWVLPEAEALDTVLNPGPYRYVLSRAPGLSPTPGEFSEVISYDREFFAQSVDTCFTDTGLNTEGQPYSYRIELFIGGDTEPFDDAQPASSVRLSGDPTDRANDLSWTANVPWNNFSYDILRRAPGETDFSLLTTTEETTFRDEGLENGLEYCYVILASGSYNVETIRSPLLNRSQELCLVAEDDVPPCPPVLTVESACDRGVDCEDDANLFNTLTWELPRAICGDNDVDGYRIYFRATPDAELELIETIDNSGVSTFEHFPPDGITGCYVVTAFDFNNNESDPSNEVCVSNCPIYLLPNAFTPNGDGDNELFIPRGRCFVERVEFQVFNRWGQLVWETEDPALNWDGTNASGDALPSGTYFYKAEVFEQRLEGVTRAAEPVSGYIELVRGE